MKNAPDFQLSAGMSGHVIDRLPRGWVVLSAAFASWLVVAGLWTVLSRVFSTLLALI